MNDLETLLEKAAREPEARPAFYAALLDADIYVLGEPTEPHSFTPEGDLPEGASVGLHNWTDADGQDYIPIFTSRDVMEKSLQTPAPYLRVTATSLLEMTRGARLILNPLSRPAKEFLPEEVANLLDSNSGYRAEETTLESGTSVEIGQPAEHPTELCEALARLFAKSSGVKSASLALMRTPGATPEFSYVIAIDIKDPSTLSALGQQVGAVIETCDTHDRPVDLITFEPQSRNLAEIVAQSTTPFYVRQKKGLFQSLFRPGRA